MRGAAFSLSGLGELAEEVMFTLKSEERQGRRLAGTEWRERLWAGRTACTKALR